MILASKTKAINFRRRVKELARAYDITFWHFFPYFDLLLPEEILGKVTEHLVPLHRRLAGERTRGEAEDGILAVLSEAVVRGGLETLLEQPQGLESDCRIRTENFNFCPSLHLQGRNL